MGKEIREVKIIKCEKCGNGFGTLQRQGAGYIHRDCEIARQQEIKWRESQAKAKEERKQK